MKPAYWFGRPFGMTRMCPLRHFESPLTPHLCIRAAPTTGVSVRIWGYVLKGQARIILPDHEEIIRAGDAYYLPPGHHVVYEAGTETLEFNPNGPFQETMSIAMRNLEEVRLDDSGAEQGDRSTSSV
jgi:hypothetical protein